MDNKFIAILIAYMCSIITLLVDLFGLLDIEFVQLNQFFLYFKKL